MPYTDFLWNETLDHVFGNAAYTAPATIYVGLHLATTLASAASATDVQIDVDDSVPDGVDLIIDPLGANPENRTVTGVSGAGPYTLTVAALDFAHSSGAEVTFDPAVDASGILEPSGNNYGRVSVTNNATNFPAASAASKSSGADFTFGDPSGAWGVATHFLLWDASSGGNCLGFDLLDAAKSLDASSSPVKFPSGQLSFGRLVCP